MDKEDDDDDFEENPIVKRILLNYQTPGHPTAFSAPHSVYLYYGKKYPLDFIEKTLRCNESFTLHKEYKRPKTYNPYYVYQRRQHFQGDLIDISALKEDNENITFLLVIIDCFSRKIWVMPLRRKTGLDTSQSIQAWLNEINAPNCFASDPFLLVDSGKEFWNRHVQDTLSHVGLELRQAKNIVKAAICERVNKSLQVLIYKYLTHSGETRYIDKLPSLVNTYNNRKHRSLKYLTPNQADNPMNAPTVRSVHLLRYSKINEKRHKKPKYRVGDKVRVKTYAKAPSSARRAYLQQFHGEIFEIERIATRMPIPFYYLKSLNTEDSIEGGFYANELSKIEGNTFKIEKILRTKGRGAQKKHLVKWKHFDEKWNSWILASAIQNV